MTIPTEAFECAESVDEATAIFRLWRHSDLKRRRPFAASSRYLQKMWGLSARMTEALLARLIAAGLVIVDSKGTNHTARTIEVWDPRKAERNPERWTERNPERQDAVADDDKSEERNAGRNATRNAGRNEDDNVQRSTSNEQQTLKGADAPRETPASRLWAQWLEISPARGKSWPKGSHIKTAIKDHGEEACALVIRWLWTAPDSGRTPSASWLREQMATSKLAVTAWRASNVPAYIEEAERWVRAGSPTSGPVNGNSASDPATVLADKVIRHISVPNAKLREVLGEDYARYDRAWRAAGLTRNAYRETTWKPDRDKWRAALIQALGGRA